MTYDPLEILFSFSKDDRPFSFPLKGDSFFARGIPMDRIAVKGWDMPGQMDGQRDGRRGRWTDGTTDRLGN